jgi:hypothetical protein
MSYIQPMETYASGTPVPNLERIIDFSARICRAVQERRSFLKKRTKRLLCFRPHDGFGLGRMVGLVAENKVFLLLFLQKKQALASFIIKRGA